MSSDVSGTVELDLTEKHNLIIQPIASPNGQQIQLSGTIPVQTFPANLMKIDVNENKAIITLIASSEEANIQMIRTPLADGIFNAVIQKIQSSSDTDKDSIAILIQIIRDSLTPESQNQDLVERLKQIYQDKENFDATWVKATPYILEALRKTLDSAIMV
jgi:hypothetical protein